MSWVFLGLTIKPLSFLVLNLLVVSWPNFNPNFKRDWQYRTSITEGELKLTKSDQLLCLVLFVHVTLNSFDLVDFVWLVAHQLVVSFLLRWGSCKHFRSYKTHETQIAETALMRTYLILPWCNLSFPWNRRFFYGCQLGYRWSGSLPLWQTS